MATVIPYKGLRFSDDAGKISELVCPPYDIISEEERLNFIKTNQNNIIRLELPREGENHYDVAGQTFKKWLEDGILKIDEKDSFYIYQIEFEVKNVKKSISGIIGRVQLEEFSKGIVLPHEETLSKAKTDRFNLFKATNCHFSQVYSLFIDDGKITAIINDIEKSEPNISFLDDHKLTHNLWIVNDEKTTDLISNAFDDKKLYIADGHHRYETSLNYRNYLRDNNLAKIGDSADYIMMFLADMSQDGLVIFPTHRIVRGLESFDEKQLLTKCSEFFNIKSNVNINRTEEELEKEYINGNVAFALYTGGDDCSILISKVSAVPEEYLSGSEAIRGLDVSVLHSLILERNLGIDKENMANQINLTYTRDFDEAIEVVRSGKANCSFILNPTKVEEIKEVALAGEKMPQKSTYFYPKLITGLVMNKIDEK